MYLKNLEVYNFRNYVKESLSFTDGLNVVCGKNAQGKTNLVEAIYLLSTGSSPRAVSDKEMINLNAEQARINAEVMWDSGSRDVSMLLSKKEKKRASVNGLGIAKIGELLGNINTVFFSPDEISLIKRSPDYRRKFMDIDLCQLSRSYFYTLNKYNKILRQRNSLLKCGKEKNIIDSIMIWDEQLASVGAVIIKQRMKFCENLSMFANEIHSQLSSNLENLEIIYQTTATSTDEAEIKEQLMAQLNKNQARDIKLGYTSVGCQRDDLKISLSGVDVRTYGSQGQQRTATLSMKLAEIDIFEKIHGEKPILILDDVLSELDSSRQTKLLQKAESLQTIITCTNAETLANKGNVIHVESGKVIHSTSL